MMRIPFLHPSARRLRAFALDEIGAARAPIQAHLADCADCRAEVAATRDLVRQTVAFAPASPVRADAFERILHSRDDGKRIVLPVPSAAPSATVAAGGRWRTGARIAAVIALVAIPLIGIAQGIRIVLRRSSSAPSVPSQVVAPGTASGARHLIGGDSGPAVGSGAVGVIPRTSAQSTGPADDTQALQPAPRPLGPVVATSAATFSAITQLVARPDGKVLVHDNVSRRVLLLDASLANAVTVFDSAGGKPNSYTTRPLRSFLTGYRGDSALFYDVASASFVVINPNGTLGRTAASPPTGSTMGFVNIPMGAPMFVPPNAVVFRGDAGRGTTSPLGRPAPGQPDSVRYRVDSVSIHRGEISARTMDTLAKIGSGSVSRQVMAATGSAPIGNAMGLTPPFPFYDDVIVMADGAIGLFHAREFRFDWIHADGTRTSGPRMTFPWRSITDADRTRLTDSINATRTRTHDSLVAQRRTDAVGRLARAGGGDVPVLAAGAQVMPLFLMTPDEVPDFYPPTASRGSVLADANNQVWIRPRLAEMNPAVQVWYVYDRAGALVDRVRLPEGRTIAGFAAGIVYLVVRDAGVARIEKVRIR